MAAASPTSSNAAMSSQGRDAAQRPSSPCRPPAPSPVDTSAAYRHGPTVPFFVPIGHYPAGGPGNGRVLLRQAILHSAFLSPYGTELIESKISARSMVIPYSGQDTAGHSHDKRQFAGIIPMIGERRPHDPPSPTEWAAKPGQRVSLTELRACR